MPHVDNPNKKGDLIIEFDIEFPQSLGPDSKEYIRRALLPHTSILLKKELRSKSAKNQKMELEEEEED